MPGHSGPGKPSEVSGNTLNAAVQPFTAAKGVMSVYVSPRIAAAAHAL